MKKSNLYKYIIVAVIVSSSVYFIIHKNSFTKVQQGDHDISTSYEKGEVTNVEEEGTRDGFGAKTYYQNVSVKLNDTGNIVKITSEAEETSKDERKLKKGESVVVIKTVSSGETTYNITDHYRLDSIYLLVLLFFLLIIIFSGWKGITAILGLGYSFLILVKFVIPEIVNGRDPLLISMIGAIFIAFSSLYLAHGFNKRTSIALAGTIASILLSLLLSLIFVSFANVFGSGSEEATNLKFIIGDINLKGLFLGSIIFGALGVLDDITTAQAAVVEEIHDANSSLGFSEVYKRATSVGKEHITSLVNTLILAYASAAFPLLVLLSIGGSEPLWITLNSGFFLEEVLRTLVGSTALIFAVPLTTALASYIYTKNTKIPKKIVDPNKDYKLI